MASRAKTSYIDVVILPDRDLAMEAVRLSKKVRRNINTAFVLNNRSFLPHISLYHVAIPRYRMRQFQRSLKSIAEQELRRALPITGVSIINKNGVWLKVAKPLWLVALHRRILQTGNKFRDRSFPPAWTSHYSARERSHIHRYGSPYVLEFFRPHITLASLDAPLAKKPKWLEALRCKIRSIPVDGLALCEIGPFHTCKRVIMRFPFSKHGESSRA